MVGWKVVSGWWVDGLYNVYIVRSLDFASDAEHERIGSVRGGRRREAKVGRRHRRVVVVPIKDDEAVEEDEAEPNPLEEVGPEDEEGHALLVARLVAALAHELEAEADDPEQAEPAAHHAQHPQPRQVADGPVALAHGQRHLRRR